MKESLTNLDYGYNFKGSSLKWAACSGATTFLTYPLDSLKIRSQSSMSYLGLRRIYRGVLYYTTQKFMNRFLCYYLWNNIYENSKEGTMIQNSLKASAITGLITALITTPLDYKKIKKQTSSTDISIISFKGYNVVFARDAIQFQFYFPVYMYLKENTNLCSFISGGICGSLSNLIVYPLDTIKTIVQQQNASSWSLVGDFRFGFSLYRGVQFSMLKSFITHGLTFLIFDW